MHTTPSKPVNPESLHEGYEVSDMRIGAILAAFAAIAIMGAAAFPICLWVINDWDQGRAPYNTTLVSPVAQPMDQVPPAPHLQQYPREDAEAYLKAQHVKLESFGVVSQAEGLKTAHIPVDKAIDAVAEGKAPYRQRPVAATLAPTVAPAAAPAETVQ
jgi:hypothetical protein